MATGAQKHIPSKSLRRAARLERAARTRVSRLITTDQCGRRMKSRRQTRSFCSVVKSFNPMEDVLKSNYIVLLGWFRYYFGGFLHLRFASRTGLGI